MASMTLTIPFPPGAAPARLRPSSTLVVVRDGAEGLQALVLKRAERGDQNSGAWVFPGGLLDASDRFAHAHADGLTDAQASARLGLPEGGLDFYLAALRECFEEAGLWLTPSTASPGESLVIQEWRAKLQRGQASLSDFCASHGLRLPASELHYISHWITPLEMPKRFDSRFFVARAPAGQDVRHDGTEMVDHRWVRPADMLEKEPAIKVMGPALHIMKQLSPFNTVSSVLDWARQLGPVPTFMPRLVRDENGRIHARLPSENPSAAEA
jgi:8-oxo-dGTP pyrophosphatase MutT (NUDIX family)